MAAMTPEALSAGLAGEIGAAAAEQTAATSPTR